jgi:OFA family oxalate/formate antiporter-like MFS transporter
MAEEKLPNRWIMVVAALVMQICLGILYSWSVFVRPLLTMYKEQGWTPSDMSWVFSTSVVFFAVGMIGAGRWQDKKGPRIVGITGGILLAAGCFLASQMELMGAGSAQAILFLGYGVLGGLGVGFAYVTPIATCVKWFPDMRGTIVGLAVFGFGFGSLVFGPLCAKLIVEVGVHSTFAIIGGVFLVFVCGAALIFRVPPAGWVPAGWTPPPPSAKKPGFTKYDYPPGEMVKTPQFFLLWIAYAFGASAGLMVISQASPMGQEMAKITAAEGAAAVGILAIFNGLGRLFLGWLSDRIGRLMTLVVMTIAQVITLGAIGFGMTTSYITYTTAISVVGACYGGYLVMMPALTADFFGTKNLGVNYGWLFTAWGCAGVIGPRAAAYIKASTGAYTQAMYIISALLVISGVLVLITKAPKAKEA